MNKLRKSFGGLAGDTLRRTVGRDQLRMLRFKFTELLHQRIVFAVRNLRAFLKIIQPIVMTNFITQPLNGFVGRLLWQV